MHFSNIKTSLIGLSKFVVSICIIFVFSLFILIRAIILKHRKFQYHKSIIFQTRIIFFSSTCLNFPWLALSLPSSFFLLSSKLYLIGRASFSDFKTKNWAPLVLSKNIWCLQGPRKKINPGWQNMQIPWIHLKKQSPIFSD